MAISFAADGRRPTTGSRRRPRDLSAEAGLGDRVSFARQPGVSGDALGALAEIVRMTAREGAVSQLRRIVILEGPLLSRRVQRALFHHQLLLALRDRQALVAAAVPNVISLEIKIPIWFYISFLLSFDERVTRGI